MDGKVLRMDTHIIKATLHEIEELKKILDKADRLPEPEKSEFLREFTVEVERIKAIFKDLRNE